MDGNEEPEEWLGFRISLPGLMILISKQGGGKSHLLEFVTYTMKKYLAYGIAITGTSFNESNMKYMREEYKHGRFDEKYIKELMRLQASIPEHLRPIAFLYLDDYMNDKNMWNSEVLQDLLTQLRHYRIFVVCCVQYIVAVPAKIREQAFQVCIFRLETQAAYLACYQSYGQNFDTLEDFKHMIMQATKEKFRFAYRNIAEQPDLWVSLKAPPKIPHFMLEYGDNDKTETKRKNKDKSDKKKIKN
jgi:hypothetical protein